MIPIAGIHSVRGALKHGGAGVEEVWLERRRRDRRLAELAELARGAGVRLRQVEVAEIEGAAPGINHQGVLAWVSVPAGRGEALGAASAAFVEAACELSNKKITVIDSRNLSATLGLVILRAMEAMKNNPGHEELVDMIHSWLPKTQFLVGIKTMKYLIRGGRVSPLKGFIANLST